MVMGAVPLGRDDNRFTWNALDEAVDGLAKTWPALSARRVITPGQLAQIATIILIVIVLFIAWPRQSLDVSVTIMAGSFLLSIVTRVGLVFLARKPVAAPAADTAEWPLYSILVPLYREAGILPQLDQALQALDYPKDKLDIHLVLEAVDKDTQRAAQCLPYSIIVVPDRQPRTKPKAANFAAQFARGEFLVVYDAEDRPEPDQLKKAVAAFRADPSISCFQARLVIDRTDCWLQHMFALDYGLWFNALLRGLEKLKAPIPLGGTSNHFRCAALIDAGLWDPFNVTEDADLGVRLARLGHKVRVLDSATYEEAPASFSVWLRQRTRWIKGYMQTLLVHTRHPASLLHEVGLVGTCAIHLFLGGAIWPALINPLLWLFFLWSLIDGAAQASALGIFAETSGALLLAVNVALAVLGVMDRRGDHPQYALALSYPLYWLLISAACYRALFQLFTDPFGWEKTPHGTAACPLARLREPKIATLSNQPL